MRTIPGWWLAALWIGSALVTAAMLDATNEWVLVQQPLGLAIGGVLLLATWCRYDLRDGATPARCIGRDLAEHFGLLIAVALIGVIATYPEAAMSAGFVDPALAHADRLLGFDWPRWYATVAAHPLLQVGGRAAYHSIFVTPAVLLARYAFSGNRGEARVFLLAFWIATMSTLLLFPHFAALGPLATLWHGPISYTPVSALYALDLIPGLRSHAIGVIDLAALRGLVEAPSFHATSALLYIAFAWRERLLRWPLALVNGAMLLSTPVEGTHYAIDMVLGAVVAVVAVTAARLAARMLPGEMAVNGFRADGDAAILKGA